MLLVEHKSRGQDLDRAYAQALDYFDGLPERDLPRYVLVSRFRPLPPARPRAAATETEFPLADLHKHIRHFAFIAGYQHAGHRAAGPGQHPAAELMGKLHDALKAGGYTGHPLEVLLVRLLFCLFADDTGIFQPAQPSAPGSSDRTAADGSDLGPQLAQLFQVLNTPRRQRAAAPRRATAPRSPTSTASCSPSRCRIADFNADMRNACSPACALDWSAISPAIFGSLFQAIMDAKARRNLGAHYTSEENILKLIRSLFLDDLRAEFERIKAATAAPRCSSSTSKLRHAALPRSRLRLRQLPRHHLPRAAHAGARSPARSCTAASSDCSDVHQLFAGQRRPVLRHRDRGVPRPDRRGRPVADGPPDERARQRGVRPGTSRGLPLKKSAAHRQRQCAAHRLGTVLPGELQLRAWESAVRGQEGTESKPESGSCAAFGHAARLGFWTTSRAGTSRQRACIRYGDSMRVCLHEYRSLKASKWECFGLSFGVKEFTSLSPIEHSAGATRHAAMRLCTAS